MSLKAMWAQNTPYSKFLLSVGIILLFAVFFTFISSLLAGIIYGISMADIPVLITDYTNPAAIPILKFFQTATAIGTFIVPVLLLGWLFDEKPMTYLSLDKKPTLNSALFIIPAVLIAIPLINYLGELNSMMKLPSFMKGMEDWMKASEDNAAGLTEAFLKMNSIGEMMFNLFMIGLIPAVGEELLFRGLIQKLFEEWSGNKHVAVWTSAFLFSCMHLQFYGFVPRLLLGVMLGYLLIWSGSLLLPMIAHFVNNASAVIFTYLMQHGQTSLDPDKIGTGAEGLMPVLFSTVLTGALLYAVYLAERRKRLLSAI
jgi:uncharacterized protein